MKTRDLDHYRLQCNHWNLETLLQFSKLWYRVAGTCALTGSNFDWCVDCDQGMHGLHSITQFPSLVFLLKYYLALNVDHSGGWNELGIIRTLRDCLGRSDPTFTSQCLHQTVNYQKKGHHPDRKSVV